MRCLLVRIFLQIRNATHALTFPCGTRSDFQDCVFRLPSAAFYQSTIKHLIAVLHLMVSLEVSFLTVPLKESVVLGGTVSNNLTVLPSGYIFQPSFRHSSIFWMKLTDFASCIGVRIFTAVTQWGVIHLALLPRFILRRRCPPNSTYKEQNLQNCFNF